MEQKWSNFQFVTTLLKSIQNAANVWNIPGWDRVGIDVTGSKLNPAFLVSQAPNNHT